MGQPIRLAVLVASDKGAKGLQQENCLPVIKQMIGDIGWEIAFYSVLPDERAFLAATLREWADREKVDLILTVGGTGCGPRDVTPEALLDVADRLVPGIPEAMRRQGAPETAEAMLSRAVAGIRGRTLIINLPGSPRLIQQWLEGVKGILPQAIANIRDGDEDWER